MRLGTLTVYEVTDDELRLIEAGDPSTVLFNFGIGSASLGVGIGATLLASTVTSMPIFIVLVLLTIVGILAGVVLLVFWRRMARKTSSLIATVRARAKTQYMSATLASGSITTLRPG